jgi:hypothetical protein
VQLPVVGTLQPERVRSVEGSFEQKLGAQRLLFGVFRSWWKDIVENHVLTLAEQQEAVRQGQVSLATFGVAQFRNVSQIENWGLNGTFEGTAGKEQQLHYGLNVTAAIARRDEAGVQRVPLTVAPQLFGNARIAYDIPGDWPTIALATHYIGKRPIDRAYDGGWPNGNYARPQLETRATITGPLPILRGLSYRLTATYSIADRGPYVVGAQQVNEGLTPDTSPQLLPLDQFRTSIGLQYDLLP